MADDPACDPNNPVHVGMDEIMKAKDILGDSLVYSPCIKSHLSSITGIDLYIKKEFLQYTGSFKERGARNMLLQMTPEKQQIGVVAASAGNHALALSYHGQLLNIPVTVVMPVVAPLMKIERCKRFKANVIVEGKDMAESKAIALNLANENGLTYVNGYDHPHILAGVGTAGLEILEQVPDVEVVIVPTGGGGMLAGISSAIKNTNPNVQVIGVEAENCPGMTTAFENGGPTLSVCKFSLADGLSVPVVGVNAFETVRHYIDKMVLVKEEHIAIAILALLEMEKCVVEGAGATPLGAIFSGLLPELLGKKVVMILSGGNIDTSVLGRVIDRGLGVLGRLIKFSVQIIDKPGGISELLYQLSNIGVSVKDIVHERAWVISDVFSVNVTVICECSGIDHANELKKLLEDNYKNADFSYFPNACTAKAIGL